MPRFNLRHFKSRNKFQSCSYYSFACPPLLAVTGSVAVYAGAVSIAVTQEQSLRKKTGQIEVRKLTYSNAPKKLGKTSIGTRPSVTKIIIENTEKVPHLLLVNVPCISLTSTKTEMTEPMRQFVRSASVTESLPPYEKEGSSLQHSEVLNQPGPEALGLPRLDVGALLETQELPLPGDLNQECRTDQIKQQLADLPPPPAGFSIEDGNESESEEEFPIAILEQ